MMEYYCHACGCQLLISLDVGRVEDNGDVVCQGCVEEEEDDLESYFESDEFKMECMIEKSMKIPAG